MLHHATLKVSENRKQPAYFHLTFKFYYSVPRQSITTGETTWTKEEDETTQEDTPLNPLKVEERDA